MTAHLSGALLVALSGAAQAPAPDPRVRAIAPFVGDDIVLVAHFKLEGPAVESLLRGLRVVLDDEESGETLEAIGRWVASLRRTGARDLFLLAGPADLPGPPAAVVPLAEGTDPTAIGKLLCGGGEAKPPVAWPTCATVHDAVFAGTPGALERARRARPESRSELALAFSAGGDAPARVLVLPSADQRRVIEEMLPTLPRELGGGPITTVTRGLLWASIALETRPEPTLRVVMQSQDPAAARAFQRLSRDALALIGRAPRGRLAILDRTEDLARLRPEVIGDRVVLDVGLERASALVGLVWLAGERTRRARCGDNLKQISLAMHNYLTNAKTFPPPYSRDADGRPLLSWRVHLLPYLDQQELYNAFHLEEPWDSPHNAGLIERIPPVYICPSARRNLVASGRTTCLVPQGEATVFPDRDGLTREEITDGFSYTFLVIDVTDDRAVVWTKPEDWEVGQEPGMDVLSGQHIGGTNAAMADGAVRFFRATISPDVFRALLTRDGGETLDPDDL